MTSSTLYSSSLRYASVIALSAALVVSPVAFTSLGSGLVTPAIAAVDTSNLQTVTTLDGATITGARVIENGQAIEISGTGWNHPGGGGSFISIKADKGKTQKNNSGVLVGVTADTTGNFTTKIPYPSIQNGYNEDWGAGSSHTLHFLSGSGKEGDTVRSPTLKIQVGVAAGEPQPEVDTAGWTEIKAEGATLKVEPLTTGENAKIRMVGKGWTKADKKSGSVVAVKLASSATGFFERKNNDTQNAYLKSLGQSELGDDHTVWILLTSDKNAVNEDEGIFPMKNDGSFDISMDAPAELKKANPGSYLAVQALSGRFASHDVRRSARSQTIPVNGVAHTGENDNSQQKCETTAVAPSAKIVNSTVTAGGKLHLVGSGWCNPAGAGAPTVAIKIDEAGISRIDDSVHSNKTIWAIIHPDDKTGEIDTWVELPHADGSDSKPGLQNGAHSLRLLAGSLAPGDLSVTYGGVGVLDFVVGKYSPNAIPDTLSSTDLAESKRHQVKVQKNGNKLTISVPGAQAGQWVQANPYIDGSVRSNWGSGWKQLDAKKQFSYELAPDLPAGSYKLAVQNGEQEKFGSLLGWDDFTQTEEKIGASQVSEDNSAGSSAIALPTPAQISERSHQSQNTAAESFIAPSNNDMSNPAANWISSGDIQPMSALHQVAQKNRRVIQANALQQTEESAEKKEKTVKSVPSKSASTEATKNSPANTSANTAQEDTQKTWFQKILTPNNFLLLGAAVLLLATVLIPSTQDKK